MNPDYASLRSYIETQRQSGITDAAIYQSLLASGWPDATVQQFLSSSPQPPYVTPTTAGIGFLKGRLGRVGFLMAIVYILVYFVVEVILAFAGHGSPAINILVILMGMIGILAVIPITISVHVRRWHDLNQSGWLTLLGLVPFAGILITILLLVLPGTSGSNKYGPTHPKSLSPKVIFGFVF